MLPQATTHKILIIGATGNVGRRVIELILTRQLASPETLVLLASPHSAGKKLQILGQDFLVQSADDWVFSANDIAIFNTESDISARFVPLALDAGAYVIDSSSYFRLDPSVPLIVPPVNQDLICLDQKLYAHANCLASPISIVLAPLHRLLGIHSVNAVTYQSTSGAGKQAMDECVEETKALITSTPYQRKQFSRQIAFNVIPQVGEIREDGYTFEEYKIIHEIKKVIGQEIAITSTAVRVPVIIGHSIALTIRFSQAYTLAQIMSCLQQAPQIKISELDYATPTEIVGTDQVHVGRIRRDLSAENSLHLWLCSDNLRRGAATDAIEILSTLLDRMTQEKASRHVA